MGKINDIQLRDHAVILAKEGYSQSVIAKLFANNDLGVFQQDCARCHTSAVTTKWLNDNIPSYIKPQDWSPNSIDLCPIENLWSILSLSVYKDPDAKNIAQLKRRLQQAWKSVKVETLQKVVSIYAMQIESVPSLKRKEILCASKSECRYS
jgi:hypothetical protein